MAAATAPIDTPERQGQSRNYPVAAGVILYAGALLALSATGFAVPAANTAGLKVIGRSEQTIDNSAGADGDLDVVVKAGVFGYNNSATNPVGVADVGKTAYVEDDNTVATTATNKVKAGRIIALDDVYVWVDTDKAGLVPAADTITGAADLAALKAALVPILQGAGIVK
ncbi:MAG TPA: hypothetical protein VL357_06015 [Rariglobus sp.]|jgi:hypothetical protein|nr:hypothetical protein [Rariglobus sp.]